MTRAPAIGLCGYGGSGKTTLIETLVRQYRTRGLRVGVILQDHHDIAIDPAGKDSDRLFRAGADVLLGDDTQRLLRQHRPVQTEPLASRIRAMAETCDLVLIEGHKTASPPCKLWLSGPDGEGPPPEAAGVDEVLPRDADRPLRAMRRIDALLNELCQAPPPYAGVLFGGGSRRMGEPKHLLTDGGRTWIEQVVATVAPRVGQVVLLGRGELPGTLRHLPVLPDVTDRPEGGPLRGLRAAMRWAPGAGWLFVACDQPCVSAPAIEWLLAQRRPGVHAVLPRWTPLSPPEPLLAWYDHRLAPALDCVRRPADLASRPGVATPVIPPHLAAAWRNLNTPADRRRAFAPPACPGR